MTTETPKTEASGAGITAPLQLLAKPRNLPIRWVDQGDKTPNPANVIGLQLSPDGLILTFGFAAPPLLSGPPESQQTELDSIEEIEGVPHSRILLTIDRFQELAAVVNQTLKVLVENRVIAASNVEGEQ